MQDIIVDGAGQITGGEYGDIRVNGAAKCEGDITARRVEVDGAFTCTGALTVGLLDCDGSAKIHGNVYAKKLDIDGLLSIAGDAAKLEAEEIECDGSISIQGQISADVIRADGLIWAREIVGDSVTIHSRVNPLAHFFVHNISKVDLIEATTITIQGVTAQEVNGHDIVVGPGCVIGKVDCDGTLHIDDRAKVETIAGEHTRV